MLIKLPELQNKGAGKVATLEIPARGTYNALYFTTASASYNAFWTEVDTVTLKIDGRTQRTYDATVFNLIGAINSGSGAPGAIGTGITPPGTAVAHGFMTIDFAEPWRRTAEGEDALAWGMADVQTFTLEVAFKSNANNTAWDVSANWSPVNRPLGVIRKLKKFISAASGAGLVTYTSLPRTDAITKIMLDGNVEGDEPVTLDVDNYKVWESRNLAVQRAHLARYGKHDNTKVAIVFDASDRLADALPMRTADGKGVQSMVLSYTASGSGNTTIYLEQFGFRD